MKILVTYNDNYKKAELKGFDKGIEVLRKQGHNLVTDIELKSEFDMKKSAEVPKYQTKLNRSLKDTDILIAEISDADAKVGFDIANALAEKKVVIALEKKGSKNTISSIHGMADARQLLIHQYEDGNIETVINAAVEDAKSKLDTKFILIISPEIDRYLDWASQTKRMHKAQIVRNSIEDKIKKDKGYKTYLQS